MNLHLKFAMKITKKIHKTYPPHKTIKVAQTKIQKKRKSQIDITK